ncbi:hypothetical protein BJX96DRAFT_57381 [Aspergillus floccosus]
MFRRRRSVSHHQPLSSSATQSAQSAASHAFLNSQPSSSSLSSAAAAAALRSLTPTPTPIENVQTKRMLQRRASVTSQSSGLSGALRPSSQNGLRRARSSSSMSNRTFREQSPHRPASSTGPVTHPPLPSIPPIHGSNNLPRRSVSVGPPSTRFTSPGRRPASSGGKGGSVDLDTRLATVPELQRAGSRNSINFSYPMNSRPNSPNWDADRRDASTGVSLAGQLASAHVPRRQESVSSQPANTSVRRKTRAPVDQGSPGRAILPVGTAMAAAQAAIVPRNDDSAPSSSPSSSPRSAVRGRPTREPGPPPEYRHAPRSVPADEPAEPDAREKEVDPVRTGRVTPDALPISTPTRTPDRTREAPSSYVVSSPGSPQSNNLSPEIKQSPQRQPSSSPGRSTRFSSHVAITGLANEQLHQPPPRSVSPAKSAMKNSRKSSLSPDGRTAATAVLRPGPPLSEISDATSVASDDVGKSTIRRKPVKVSFDDEAEVVGVAASPPTSPEDIAPEPSLLGKPRSRTGWFGVVKRKPAYLKADELDEVLTPRPALPSFGSIRGRNGRPPDVSQHDFSDNESTTSSESSPLSFSNDHVIGGILANAHSRDASSTTKHTTPPAAAAAAATEREAHVVDPSNGPFADAGTQNVRRDPGLPPNAQQTKQTQDAELTVPGIAVQPATPELAELELGRSSLECTVPGGFPRSSSEFFHGPRKQSDDSQNRIVVPQDSTPAIDGTEADDESGESIYSDAEEGFDENGFGSINAIVDGRSAAGPPKTKTTAQDHSVGSKHATEEKDNLPRISEANQIAPPMSSRQDVGTDIIEPPPRPLPFPAANQPPSALQPSARTNSTGVIPHSSTAKNPARRSVSVDTYDGPTTADATSLAATDPVQPELTHRTSFLRQEQSKEQAKKRSLSWGPALLKGGKSSPEPSVNGKTSHILQRRSSNGSDSSSSFKRSHRPRTESQHTMRRTLRAAPPNASAQAIIPKQAPTASRPLSSGSGTGNLRSTLRIGEPRREKPSFFSTGKVQKARTGTFTSRFADSDDEIGESHGPSRWRSRYADSSDDDHERVAQTLRPVRGIPRRQGMHDGDSTELEDSSDDDRRARTATAPARSAKRLSNKRNGLNGQKSDATGVRNPAFAAVAKSRGMTEDELEEFMHQPSTSRRPSLLGRLSRRKSKPPPGRSLSTSAAPPRNGSVDPAAPVLDGRNGHGVTTTITANNTETSSPKLLKKRTNKLSGEDWPLPSGSDNSSAEARPPASANNPTANGVERNGTTAVEPAPETAEKLHDGSQSVTGEGRHLASNRSIGVLDVGFGAPRKKRFPRLRKAFGLH